MSRLIDADPLPRHGDRGGLVHWQDIENAPTIEPPRWIPVSERLPEEEDMYKAPKHRYLCQLKGYEHVLVLARLRHYLGSPRAAFWDWYGKPIPDKEVIAWRPLPEPYEEGAT